MIGGITITWSAPLQSSSMPLLGTSVAPGWRCALASSQSAGSAWPSPSSSIAVIVHVCEAGSPAALPSRARTWNVCVPTGRPVTAYGDEQGSKRSSRAPTLHSYV